MADEALFADPESGVEVTASGGRRPRRVSRDRRRSDRRVAPIVHAPTAPSYELVLTDAAVRRPAAPRVLGSARGAQVRRYELSRATLAAARRRGRRAAAAASAAAPHRRAHRVSRGALSPARRAGAQSRRSGCAICCSCCCACSPCCSSRSRRRARSFAWPAAATRRPQSPSCSTTRLSTSAVIGGRPVLQRLAGARARSARTRIDARIACGSSPRTASCTAAARDARARCRRAHRAIRRRRRSARRDVARGDARSRRGARPLARSSSPPTGKRTSWGDPLTLGDVPVHACSPPVAPPANHAVVAVRATRALDAARRRARAARSRPIPRRIASRSAGARSRAGSPRATRRSSLRAAPPERGWLAGTVELEPDELRADDVRYFAVWIGPAPAVVAGSARPAPSRDSALDALVAERSREHRQRRSRSRPPMRRRSSPRCSSRPRDPVRLGAANRALERLGIPWRFGAAVRGESVARDRRLRARARRRRPSCVALHAHARGERRAHRYARDAPAASRGSSPDRATCSSPRRSTPPRRPSRARVASSRGSPTCSRSA